MAVPIYEKLSPPKSGSRVTVDSSGKWQIPDDPIVCLLKGDGIGEDVKGVPGITTCAVKVLDAAVQKAYGGKRKIHWFDIHESSLRAKRSAAVGGCRRGDAGTGNRGSVRECKMKPDQHLR